MRIENIYPEYENGEEREKSVQEVYTELQLIFYNKSREKREKGGSRTVCERKAKM